MTGDSLIIRFNFFSQSLIFFLKSVYAHQQCVNHCDKVNVGKQFEFWIIRDCHN